MLSKRFFSVLFVSAALSPAFLEGCSSTSSNPLCCTEFKVGAQVDANIGGSADSKIAVQAVADLGGITASAIADLTTSCQGIAQDLSASDADQQAAASAGDANAVMKAWCNLAVKQIGTFNGQFKLTVIPPQCSASVSVTANCQANCQATAKCDIKANPPTCKGGTLEIECKGNCTASAGAQVSCTGSCSGNCSGSCTAQGGVQCMGKCDGQCSVATDSGGNCNGMCNGTCSVVPPSVKCSGTCNGKCDATCQGSASASVKCDGKCDADYQPISCSGGTLEGGCQVDAKCSANCNASAQAKADCTPPQITVVATGSADISKLIATLKANLGVVFTLKQKFSTFGDITANLAGNIGAVTDIKAACILPVAQAAGQVVTDATDSISATASLSGSVGAQ